MTYINLPEDQTIPKSHHEEDPSSPDAEATPAIAEDRQDRGHHDIIVAIKAEYPIIVIETTEEHRVREILVGIFSNLGVPLHWWTITKGLRRAIGLSLVGQTDDNLNESELGQLGDVLRYIEKTPMRAGYALFDSQAFLSEPVTLRMMKDIVLRHDEVPRYLILVGVDVTLPIEISHFATKVRLPLPTRRDVEHILREEAQRWLKETGSDKLRVSRKALKLLTQSLTGLPASDVARLARRAIYEDGRIGKHDVQDVLRYREELLGNEGVLSFDLEVHNPESLGGFASLKRWVSLRTASFLRESESKHEQIERPKGILIVGIQGCGKSLAAKVIAGTWSVPLLRFDVGSLLNKYIGESERNLRRAFEIAEAMGPCVLWMDEIEKGFATNDHDGGTTRRMLGTLLTWMSERDAAVFLAATANVIEALPPELVREGRFDEIFFVDLPNVADRAAILSIHLRARGVPVASEDNSTGVDVAIVAEATDGFSGSELEQLIISASYHSLAENIPISSDMLIHEATSTRPLSVTMAEKIGALRSWATTRAVHV